MTKKEKILFFTSLLMLLAGFVIVFYKSDKGYTRNIELISLKKQNGWGYQINVNYKNIIQQDNIPGISSYKPFINEEEALRAGELVVKKLKLGKLPTLNKSDLDAISIHY